MKKTQRKDAWRNIRRQSVSFASIVVIALLGVASFLSIGYASRAMALNATERYGEMAYRHIEVISTLMLSPEDMDAIRAVEGVTDAEMVWQAGASFYLDGRSHTAVLITAGQRINKPQIIEGRLTQAPDEIAFEPTLAQEMGVKVGDRLEMPEMLDSSGQYFLYAETFTVTGIAVHPDHVSRSLSETPYALVTRDAFDQEALAGVCMKAEVLTAAAEGDRFDQTHRAAVLAVRERIEALAETRTPLRTARVKQDAYEELDEAEANYSAYMEEAAASGERTQAEIHEARASFATSMAQQRRAVDEMAPCRWIVLDERGSADFMQLLTGSENLGSLQMTFALLFVVIGALVIYATVSKMVAEQRTLIGTTKALGFYVREVLAKYLLFGVSATVMGMLLGVLLARFYMESIALNGYNDYFFIDISKPGMDAGATAVVLVSGVLLATGAVLAACLRLIRLPATQLLQAAVPKGKTRPETGRRTLLSLYSRLILRNMRTDWKRIAVTLISVAGCCALIVIGFTLKNAVAGCMKKQYSEIVDYDMELDVSYGAEDVEACLDRAGADYVPLYTADVTLRIDDTDVAELLCGDVNQIGRLYHLYDWKTGRPFTEATDGVLIHRRLAETYGLDAGSEMELSVALANTATVRVAGVFENYLGLPLVMSKEFYETVYGETWAPDTYFVRLNGADRDALMAEIEESVGSTPWTPSNADRAAFEASTDVINSVVALFIAMAAVMAGVVLLNLTNSHLLEKRRELTVMRVNGFTVGETIGYVLRESAVTTALGIVLGVAAGAGMAYRIVRSLEQSYMQFDRGVCLTAWGLGALITLAFALIVNIIALRKVKDLKLTDLT